MKTGRLYYLVTLSLFAVAQSNAQTTSDVSGVFPNTNIIYSFPVLGFAQGTCNDGTNTYWFGTQAIQQRSPSYQWMTNDLHAYNTGITNGLDNFGGLHLGDPDYYQGYIYAPMEARVGVPQGSANIDIAIFTATNLARCAAISISNYQSEASAVCIDPAFSNSVALFAASFMSASTNDGIYEYSVNNLTNITFVKPLPMTQNIQHIQGIICIGGMLYVLGDNGPAGELYQVNPTNGVVVHLAQINIATETEWEGLDYFHGFLVANEGWSGTANWFDFFGALSNQTISGSVIDSNHHPIAGVGVIATAIISGTNQTMTVDADTNGNYSLTVTNGSWNIAVNWTNGADSLSNLGSYAAPNSQNVGTGNSFATVNFTVQICSGITVITPPSLPVGEADVFYNQILQASSCSSGFIWTQTAGSLPSGLSLSADGTIFGVPSGSGGVFNFIVQITDANNWTTNQFFSISINNAVQITTASLPAGTSIQMPLSVSNGLPSYTWSLSPGSASLPSNLLLTTNGMLSTTSATNGTFSFSVRVKDSLGGIADQPLSLTLTLPKPYTINDKVSSVTAGLLPGVLPDTNSLNVAIECVGQNLALVYPGWASNCVVETSANASPGSWTSLDCAPTNINNYTVVFLPATNAGALFRLRN